MKPIRWTAHARKKVAARELSMAEVEQAIAQPDSVVSGRPPRRIFMRRYFDDVLQSEMLLRVVVEETDTDMAVVTLYKTSKFEKYEGGT
ncbi:MAG: DUF4258 domain-containing protein [Candidatus Hydrogenedentes bacterium]|nr:DUF4258 domain-containing protein [Candidatus Hydrogenedentota bacterium]